MATTCPNCGGTDTTTEIDRYRCLTCGKGFDGEGNLVAPGADASTREALEARLEPRSVNVVGNLADLQRLGAQEVSDPKADAFVAPAGVDADELGEGGTATYQDDGSLEPDKKAAADKADKK